MKKITIGIPKAFLYYRYNLLWKTFFEKLNCKIIESEDTTKETIELGKSYSVDESCLSSKIYIGHVANLIDKCDYLLIPRAENYGKNEKVCVKFNATYDIIKNLFPNTKILDYNIDKKKNPFTFISFLKLGFKITKNPFKIIKSYLIAKTTYQKNIRKKYIEQTKKLNNNKLKILIVSHPYNIYDNYIGIPIIKKLESMNIEIIYADKLNPKISKMYARTLSPTLYWTYSKELIGSIPYYQHSIDGVIFLTSFPCGPDSLVNELLLRKINNIPMTNILIDELTSSTGLETRLESFVDIITERRKQNDER